MADINKTLENTNIDSESKLWLSYEALQERYMHERKWHLIENIIKDVILLAVVITFILFLSNFSIETATVETDGDYSHANYIGGNLEGTINNGGEDSCSQMEKSEGETETNQNKED